MLNQNEKYLLKYISNENSLKNKDSLVNIVLNMGIDIKIRDLNPIYQIIDELNFATYKKSVVGK